MAQLGPLVIVALLNRAIQRIRCRRAAHGVNHVAFGLGHGEGVPYGSTTLGDHGLEYMTGGCAVILGPTGRNFAAGMSGGAAYVYDKHNALLGNCNLEMVELEKVIAPEDLATLKDLLAKHHKHTGSTVASTILQNWDDELAHFVKVMPIDYKRALAEQKKELAKA